MQGTREHGSGMESQVIAGMEWAVAQGVRVVNTSLGTELASDSTDVMSLAINEISRSSDALFVVVAGNTGGRGDGHLAQRGRRRPDRRRRRTR
ncbi:S8 family serine peptidase [Streptomyces sp. NBC_01800]|uniref:S8 family serine peptidase n=1 Tax=Streptomyces sp. NBC_01800 TaxID=2975945 RepID=UPI002DD80C9B|nr:S8 family serine peptidase [Streptomyces sp. NBC_01800]